MTFPVTDSNNQTQQLLTGAELLSAFASVVTALGLTQPVSAASLPLPAGAATDSSLQSILTRLGTARVETQWTDDTGAFYVRVDNAGTITWFTPGGAAISDPSTGAGFRPAAGASVLLDRVGYVATAAATGYSIGDYLDHLITTDPQSGVVLGSFWINSTTNAKLATAPATANISPLSPLPTGAATAALQTAGNTSAAAIVTALAGLLKVDTVVQATATPRSASVGTTASALMAANASRRGFAIQNQSSTAKVYINGTAAATADFNSLMIPPLGYYETPPGHTGVGAISIISDTASTPVYAREW